MMRAALLLLVVAVLASRPATTVEALRRAAGEELGPLERDGTNDMSVESQELQEKLAKEGNAADAAVPKKEVQLREKKEYVPLANGTPIAKADYGAEDEKAPTPILEDASVKKGKEQAGTSTVLTAPPGPNEDLDLSHHHGPYSSVAELGDSDYATVIAQITSEVQSGTWQQHDSTQKIEVLLNAMANDLEVQQLGAQEDFIRRGSECWRSAGEVQRRVDVKQAQVDEVEAAVRRLEEESRAECLRILDDIHRAHNKSLDLHVQMNRLFDQRGLQHAAYEQGVNDTSRLLDMVIHLGALIHAALRNQSIVNAAVDVNGTYKFIRPGDPLQVNTAVLGGESGATAKTLLELAAATVQELQLQQQHKRQTGAPVREGEVQLGEEALRLILEQLDNLERLVRNQTRQLWQGETSKVQEYNTAIRALKQHLEENAILLKKLVPSYKICKDELTLAVTMLPQTRAELESLQKEFNNTHTELQSQRQLCRDQRRLFWEQIREMDERRRTLLAIRASVLHEQIPARLLAWLRGNSSKDDPCKGNPCARENHPDAEHLHCVPHIHYCDFEGPCPQHRCVSTDGIVAECFPSPCPPHHSCEPQERHCVRAPCPQYECIPQFPPRDCRDAQKRGLATGVYGMLDEELQLSFRAYCDMDTADGGWMLAYKQSNFNSGSLRYNPGVLGDALLLDEHFNGTTNYSALLYHEPKELLFRSSDPKTWFIVPATWRFQDWQGKGFGLWCLRFGDRRTGAEPELPPVVRSPEWNHDLFDIWDDTVIELVNGEAREEISAVTIGREYAPQNAPQCYMSHCSYHKHGRYTGDCATGARGEGNWMIFIR